MVALTPAGERENRSTVAHVVCVAGYGKVSGLNTGVAEIEMMTQNFSCDAQKLSLSPGERVGVRADIN